VSWLGEEAVRRYEKLEPSTFLKGNDANGAVGDGKRRLVIAEIRKTKGGAILDPDDVLSDVLDDNDFVSVGTPW
jgi:histidine ammonia-lyase